MKILRSGRLALRYACEILAIAGTIITVVVVSAGGRVFHWEIYSWAAVLVVWIVMSGYRRHLIDQWMMISATWQRICGSQRELLDELLPRNAGESAPGHDHPAGMI